METITGKETAAAPSAAAPTPPSNLADFAELARQSIANAPAPAARTEPAAAAAIADPTETPVAGQESPPVAGADPAADPAAVADPALEPTEETAEPTAEEQAAWTDSERRIHGALQKERAESKAARAETRALREKITALESKLQTPPATGKPATGQPANGTPAPTAAAPSAPALAECQTFAAVDQQVTSAAATEAQIVRLQGQLARNGTEAVAKFLTQEGIKVINGIAVAEADANVLGDFLDAAYAGARTVQAGAAPRKEFIAIQENSWKRASAIAPEINDITSPFHKQVLQIVQTSPELKGRSNWPEIAVKLAMGNEAWNAKAKPAPAAATAAPAKPAAKLTPKPAPGAPTRSGSAAPAQDPATAIQKRIKEGTATLADVQALAKSQIAVA